MLTAAQLADAIRQADSLDDLKRLVGPDESIIDDAEEALKYGKYLVEREPDPLEMPADVRKRFCRVLADIEDFQRVYN